MVEFDFWKMAYDMGCCTIEQLKEATKTEKNPNGYITPEEFKKICGQDFIQ